MYLVVIESAVSALVGARATWKHIPRTGDVELPADALAPEGAAGQVVAHA
jgi:hypothetical protein